MKKTFEELIDEKLKNYDELSNNFHANNYEFTIELMKLVKEQTLIEVAGKAEADWIIVGTSERATLFQEENIECYVLKESILQLDKNSVEI